MCNANELMGILHGAYGLGATIGPLIATAMITKAGLQWYAWYYVMIGLSVLEFVISAYGFRSASGADYRAQHPPTPQQLDENGKPRRESRTLESLKSVATWLIMLMLFAYVGVEVSFGGWIVTFMLEVRHGESFASGMVATGFWLGITVGRVVLGFITGRIGEKPAVLLYTALSVALELCFWLIPNFVSSAIFAAWIGFFLGPLFPAAIMVTTQLLPKRLHVSAVGFVAAVGSSGAAVWPFVVGAVAQSKGVKVLQPFALALLVTILIVWFLVPGGVKKNGLVEAHHRMLEKEKLKNMASPATQEREVETV
jgi:fucose permease